MGAPQQVARLHPHACHGLAATDIMIYRLNQFRDQFSENLRTRSRSFEIVCITFIGHASILLKGSSSSPSLKRLDTWVFLVVPF